MSLTTTASFTPAESGCETDTLEELAYRYGRCYDSYLILEPGRQYLWSRSGKGVVGYVRVGRYLKISGGLIAPDDEKQNLLAEVVEFAAARKLVTSFYNIPDEDLPLFEKHGFQITKWGEEPIIDLPGCSYGGKAFEWVRRQSNYCRRKELDFQECRREALSDSEWDAVMRELDEITQELVATRPQKSEMRFLQGELDPDNPGRKRIFLARSAGGMGRIEGFLVCNPGLNGDFWAFEIYRHRPDAVRGTIPFLMHQTMQLLQSEGIGSVSLCLVPGMGCDIPRPGDSRLARWGLSFGSKYFGFLFDSAGMYHFKSRFRPRFESRYVCVIPKVTLGSSWAFIRLLGVLEVDPWKLYQILWDWTRKRFVRGSLATSEGRDLTSPSPSI